MTIMQFERATRNYRDDENLRELDNASTEHATWWWIGQLTEAWGMGNEHCVQEGDAKSQRRGFARRLGLWN